VVAACYRGELRAWRPGDEAAELRVNWLEGAILRRRHAHVRHCSGKMNVSVIVSSPPRTLKVKKRTKIPVSTKEENFR
jgi:hypothetical protein